MDIKAKITEIVDKIKSDPSLLANLKADPIKTIEGIIGVDLPDEKIKEIVDGVKEKFSADGVIGETAEKAKEAIEGAGEGLAGKLKEGLGGIGEKLGGLFK